MDVPAELCKVHPPIRPYQTRTIRLHGANSAADSPLVCELYPADILHSKFEGLGVHAPPGEADYIAEYEALSYTWGSPEATETITCNDVDFPITENLFRALQALRPSRNTARHLWVDAICINQTDDNEKGEQVWHMLQIYQKATRVIAWLGTAHEDLVPAVAAASLFSPVVPEDVAESRIVYRGMCDLYMRPWFQRIWIQQEIFAAR